MKFKTVDYWDEQLWKQVSPIYIQAFAEKGAKPEKIIKNMFHKKICYLHVAKEEGEQPGELYSAAKR